MSSATAVAAGRAAAEREMSLTLTAYSPNGTTTDVDGFQVPAYTNEGSTVGKAQAGLGGLGQGSDTSTRFLRIGEVDKPVLSGGLHIPIAAPIPEAGRRGSGWEYLVTAVGASDDPALLGRRYLVVDVPAKSFATARRLDVVEV